MLEIRSDVSCDMIREKWTTEFSSFVEVIVDIFHIVSGIQEDKQFPILIMGMWDEWRQRIAA